MVGNGTLAARSQLALDTPQHRLRVMENGKVSQGHRPSFHSDSVLHVFGQLACLGYSHILSPPRLGMDISFAFQNKKTVRS